MGIPTFKQLKIAYESKKRKFKFTIPSRKNLSIDISSIIHQCCDNDNIEEFAKRVTLRIHEIVSAIRPQEVFITTDGEQPLQKKQTQLMRSSGIKRSIIRLSKQDLFATLKYTLREYLKIPVYYDFALSGEGEMKAIAFNEFSDPNLIKLVFSIDNDVHAILGLIKRKDIPVENWRTDTTLENKKYSYTKVTKKFNYSPHAVYKVEFLDGNYSIVEMWKNFSLSKSRIFVIAMTCLFGNDYIADVFSGTPKQWNSFFNFFDSRITELIDTEDVFELCTQGLKIATDFCQPRISENITINEYKRTSYIARLIWWIEYTSNATVCFDKMDLDKNGNLISEEMLMVKFSEDEFKKYYG